MAMSPHRQRKKEANMNHVSFNIPTTRSSNESAGGSDESTIRESYHYTSPEKGIKR